MRNVIITVLLGFYFGFVFIASHAFSWYQIDAMFHFKSFHMYGLILSAIGTASITTILIKKFKLKSINGNLIKIKLKSVNWRNNILGGLIFGAGWAISGACTTPIFAFIGLKWQIGMILFGGFLFGTLIYGLVEKKIN